MPHGHNMARCLYCGKEWVVGDSISIFCSDECEARWKAWWFQLPSPPPPAGTGEGA